MSNNNDDKSNSWVVSFLQVSIVALFFWLMYDILSRSEFNTVDKIGLIFILTVLVTVFKGKEKS